ncbi:MAG TPA: hypothetical protein VF526_05060 [Solirubrobacteraceae bacterium]|jgi:hypothetical protein
MGAERGQATVDYVALVAVVVLILGAAASGVGIGAPGIANAVLGQVHRALCLVSGRGCQVQRALPCAVASTRDSHHFAVNVLLMRVDRDRYVLRERLSDGTIRLTVAGRNGAGIEVGVGLRLQVEKDGRTIGAVDEARAGIQGVFGRGQVFSAQNDREADAIMRAIRGDGGQVPPPSTVFYEGGLRELGRFGLSSLVAGVGFEGASEVVLGVQKDADGQLTIALNYGASANALAHALRSGPAVIGGEQVVMGLTLDREGRQVELSLSGAAAPASGTVRLNKLRLVGRRREFTARVDLTDPGVAAAWADFRRSPKNMHAIRALAERLRARAHVDVRTYGTRSLTSGAAGGIGAFFKLGAEREDTVELARLESAATRPPGGLWEPRLDCVPMEV